MARHTKEVALETSSRILDVAECIFSAKGVSRTSLADIARASGVTRGAIYCHFENKEDVFTAMFDRVLMPLAEINTAMVAPSDPHSGASVICVSCVCTIQRWTRRGHQHGRTGSFVCGPLKTLLFENRCTLMLRVHVDT